MITTNPSATICGRRFAAALSLLVAAQLHGQAVAPATSPADLAKYDKNKNGVLDPDELAQKTADESKKETIVLSPFEVSTDRDVGYTAGNTLSGGRVDTPLEITPGSISVMTKEFMEDFNVTDMNQAGSWMIGFDLGTAVPNSDPSSISVYQNIVRGAPSADNFPTRNGSINFGAADSYNTDRFEFQRGPDTAMFGDGGPGGRQGSSSKRGRFNSTSASVSMQADNWNGYRYTLDYNKGWDRLALRFNALTQNAPGYQPGMNKFKNAATLRAEVKVTRNMTVTAEYERSGDWNNLWSITNGDSQNSWDSVTINNDNSVLLGNNNANLTVAGLERMSAANGGAANMFVWNYATNTMMDYGGNQYRTRGFPNLRIPYEGNPYVIAIPARRAPIRGMDPKFTLAAKDNVADRDSSTASLNVEHRVGNLSLRLGYVRNSFDNNTIYSNTSPNAAIIDVNRLMPNGQLNSRFLRYFTDVEQNNAYSQDATQEYSGQASYRFSKPKWWNYGQVLNLNLRHRDTQGEGATRSWRRTDNPTASDPFANANRFFYRVYWGDPRADHAPILTNPNGKAIGTWAYVEQGGNKTERTVDTGSITSQSTFFKTAQGDKLALTMSYTRTESDVTNYARVAGTAANGYKNTLGAATDRTSGSNSKAFGIVGYPFRTNNESQSAFRKWISPIGFVFNFAENTQQPSTASQRPLLDGSEPPTTHSQTKDFGLRYSISGGKVYFTLSHYQTDQIDNPANFGSGTDITGIWTNLGYTDPKLTTTTTGSGFSYSDPSSRRLEGWEAELQANPTRNITLQLNYSHPRSYIIKESEDRKAYIAQHRAEWEAGAKLPQGYVFPDGRVLINPTQIQTDLNDIDNSLAGLTGGTLESGRENHRINANFRYRFSEGTLRGLGLVAGVQYRGHQKTGSRDTRIKFGLSDAPGSPAPTAQQDAAAAWDYLWVPPNWKHTIQVGANYTRRFGKYNWRFQMNINNLLNELSPVWGRSGLGYDAVYNVASTNAFNAGNPRTQFLFTFANPEPRRITLSSTVSF
jgi:iron complex outermembrane recepter protein